MGKDSEHQAWNNNNNTNDTNNDNNNDNNNNTNNRCISNAESLYDYVCMRLKEL